MATFKYRFDTIREIADKARRDYRRDPNGIPVDVERMIEFKLKIRIVPVEDLKSQLDMEAMLANDLKTIFIDGYSFGNPNFDNRTRFSLAHELGHYFLHRDLYQTIKFETPKEWIDYLNDIDPNDLEWFERQANEFAGRLLVPIGPLGDIVRREETYIKTLEREAKSKGIKDGEELDKWKRYALARRISTEFKVSPETMEMRLRKEKIPL
jgi:Zn-dependent peptidase ImmA (M78 family)